MYAVSFRALENGSVFFNERSPQTFTTLKNYSLFAFGGASFLVHILISRKERHLINCFLFFFFFFFVVVVSDSSKTGRQNRFTRTFTTLGPTVKGNKLLT